MSASQRRKGHNFERAIVHRLREAMPGADIKRGFQCRGGTKEAADVECPVFYVECKVGKMPNPRAALKQATDAAPPGRWPIGVIKDDRRPEFVVMRLDDFLDLTHEWWMGRQR